MKQLMLLCLSFLLTAVMAGCGKQVGQQNVLPATKQAAAQGIGEARPANGKVLVAYFSMDEGVPKGADAYTHATPETGNTHTAAAVIREKTGGDLFAIKTVKTYPENHKECSAIAGEEMRADARPELSGKVENMADYDTLYVGYPIWWGQEPMAVRTFLTSYDLKGKKIIPFCTTLGAPGQQSEANIKNLCPDAQVGKVLTLMTGRNFNGEVAQWLEAQ